MDTFVFISLVLCYDVPSCLYRNPERTNCKHRLQKGPFVFLFCFLAFLGPITWLRIQQGIVSLYATTSHTMDLHICIGRFRQHAPSLLLTMLYGAEIGSVAMFPEP